MMGVGLGPEVTCVTQGFSTDVTQELRKEAPIVYCTRKASIFHVSGS